MLSSSKEVCEEMTERRLTLRGQFTIDDNALGTAIQIFSYEAFDMTRGWEIESAYCFPSEIRGTYANDGQYVAQHTLLTDTATFADFDDITDVADNRQCAWNIQGYNGRDGNFISNVGSPMTEACRFVCDPHTIIVNKLFIATTSVNDTGSSPSRKWNYLVILKPVKMKPEQTILQIVKGQGQNISN